jgi:hypothetical protein
MGDEMPKRPVGRPRKDGLPAGSVPAKRKRGRPKKEAVLAFAGNKVMAAPKQTDEFMRGFAAGWLAASEGVAQALKRGGG